MKTVSSFIEFGNPVIYEYYALHGADVLKFGMSEFRVYASEHVMDTYQVFLEMSQPYIGAHDSLFNVLNNTGTKIAIQGSCTCSNLREEFDKCTISTFRMNVVQ